MASFPVRTFLESFITATNDLGESQFIKQAWAKTLTYGLPSAFEHGFARSDAALDRASIQALQFTSEPTLRGIVDQIAELDIPESFKHQVRKICSEYSTYLDSSPFLHFWETNVPPRRLIFETIIFGQCDERDRRTASRFESWRRRPDYREICGVFDGIVLQHFYVVVAISRLVQQVLKLDI